MAGLGEDEDTGGYACVGLEHARGHGDDRLQAMVLDQLLADGLVGGGGTEEHAIGHDAGAATAHIQHLDEQGEEEQLGLFGFAYLEQIGRDGVVVQTALEGRVGQNERVLVPIRVLV